MTCFSTTDPFNPTLFKEHALLATTKLADYLAEKSIKGLALTDPHELLHVAENLTFQNNANHTEKLAAIIDLYSQTGIQVYSTGYMGRQFSGGVPLAGIVDFVSAILNQPSSFYEAAQLPNVAEKIMAAEFNRFIGWKENDFAMLTTSGGSLANLTALLSARNHKYPKVWSDGINSLPSSCKPAIAVSAEAHYSISRATGILGIGQNQIISLPTTQKKQICVEKAKLALETAQQRGLDVFCMVASVGTTATGAFDPLSELAELACEKNIWLHVDACHGGGFLVSDKLRYKLKGIEQADSFVIDAHKMLFVPAVCTLLFYKDKQKTLKTFAQEASYVFENQVDNYAEFESAAQNFECTKRPLIMNLWVLWAIYGQSLFAEKQEYLCELTEKAYQFLTTTCDFQVLHQPEANILCFRYCPADVPENQLSDLQTAIRNQLRAHGKFFISKVDIDGKTALRVVMMNHQITLEHFHMLLNEIRKEAQNWLSR